MEILQINKPFKHSYLVRIGGQRFAVRLEKARIITPVLPEIDKERRKKIKAGEMYKHL